MKPMLLERKNPDLSTLPYPVYISPKLDGIRCLLTKKGPRTRSLKPVPNKFINSYLSFWQLSGLDGELIVGPPNGKDVFNLTTRGVRAKAGEPDFKFYAFDFWDQPDKIYDVRIAELEYHVHSLDPNIVFLPSTLVDNEEELLDAEEGILEQGYEGVIIRCRKGLYKFGRTTMKEQNTYKLKRFEDAEAHVIGMVPKFFNGNAAFTNELGRTARSKAAAGLVELDTMGALILKDIVSGVEFQCGSGFDDAQRKWWYLNWHRMMADKALITYKKFLIGEKDKPRHPIFKGVRMNEDI
jgi:DNA ligase-1